MIPHFVGDWATNNLGRRDAAFHPAAHNAAGTPALPRLKVCDLSRSGRSQTIVVGLTVDRAVPRLYDEIFDLP
jgi:hypothetical protein